MGVSRALARVFPPANLPLQALYEGRLVWARALAIRPRAPIPHPFAPSRHCVKFSGSPRYSSGGLPPDMSARVHAASLSSGRAPTWTPSTAPPRPTKNVTGKPVTP